MQLTQSINTILLSLLVLVECIIHAHLLSVPDPDPGIIGPKIFDLNGGWTVVTSNPLTSEVKPIPPINEHWKDANTIIFVTIPHYRDPRCATTVKNLLTKAKHSHRLRFGIIQQRHTEEDFFKCVDDVTTDLQGKKDRQGNPLLGEHQLRLIEFTHQQASGPNFARSFAKQLLQEEDEFCLSIDAHSDVAQDWDDDLMKMWAATDNEFAVLSTQPPDIKQLSEGSQGKVPHLCQATVDKSGKVVNLPPTIATDLIRPILAPLYSEAFSFSKCHAMRKVPNDPFMEIFYDGDEFAKFLRLWTKGYDIYTPNKAVVFHDYHNKLPVIRATNKEISPMEWNMHSPGRKDQMRALYDRTIERLDHLYGASFLTESNAFEDDDTVIEEILKLHRYGTLTTPAVDLMPADEVPKDAIILKRDLFDFMKFTGVNTMKREVFADRCRDLEWIPSYSPSVSSVAVKKIDPWVDEMNVFGSNAAERLSVSQSHVPFPVSSNGGEVKLAFYGLEDFTRLPVFASSSEEKVADNPKVVVDHAEVLTNAHESHKVVAAKILPTLDAHRGGELWYIFQWLDSTVEQTINQIDLEMGYGHGHKVMRVFLVFFPLVCLLIGLAIYLLMPSDRRAQYFSYSDDGDSYKVK